MLKLIKSLFGGQPAPVAAVLPAEFPAYAAKAIQLIASSNGQLEDKELRALFVAKGIPETEATELLPFLPTAFCRHMLPQVAWPTFYIEYISEEKKPQLEYSQNLRYVAMQQAMTSYLAGDFTQADFLKIAGRSASFKTMNRLLIANTTFKPEDIEFTPEYVVR